MTDMSSPLHRIRKYKNRRLYSEDVHGYIRQRDLLQLIRDGGRVLIIEKDTERDVTVQVIVQAIVEMDGLVNRLFSSEHLHRCIRSTP